MWSTSPMPAGFRRNLWSALFVAFVVAAGAWPAAASWMVPPRPWRAKDFAIVKRGALYHIFYTRTNTLDPNGASELSFGHATSNDLYGWTQQDTILPVDPADWDNLHVWAPHIVESEGVYYLFYTGVTQKPGGMQFHQRIGLATSTDLFTWNRLDQPIFDCSATSWVYCDTTSAAGGNLRDPFVMPNPSGPGWLMYYSAVPSTDVSRYVVGVASSPGDLAQWADLQPLWVTYYTTTGYELAESPHLFQHDGLWYLVITTNGQQPLSWATGPDPLGDPSSWTWRGSLTNAIGLDTRFWFASETLRDGAHDFFCFANFDRTDVREMQWHADGTFSLTQPDPFHVLDLHWDRDSVVTGGIAELRVQSVNFGGRYAPIRASWLHDGVEEPVANAAIGLPDSIVCADTLTTFGWSAQRVPGAPDTSVTRLIVRLADSTAVAPVLYVGPTGFCGPGGSDPGGEIIDPGLVHRPTEGRMRVRALYHAPVTGGLGLVIELDAAAAVRLDVFDLQGRRLGTLADRTMTAGATLVPWDAQRAGAQRPGVVFVRMTTPAGACWTRLVIAPR
jgi:beta-fructofuranosidase